MPAPHQARDPRTDPKAGDCLMVNGRNRRVTSIVPVAGHYDVHYYSPERQRYGKCWYSTWQEWARNAEVIHSAE